MPRLARAWLPVVAACLAASGFAQRPYDTRIAAGAAYGLASYAPPTIVATGTSVHVAFPDYTRPGGPDLTYSRSTDGGRTWTTPTRLNLTGAGGIFNPRLAAAGDLVCATWQSYPSSHRVYLARSLDGGATWTAPIAFDNGTSAGIAVSPVVCTDGTAIHLAWDDTNGVYFDCSYDRGATWLPAAIRISHGPGIANLDLQLAIEGSSVYALWTDYAVNFTTRLLLNASTDRGQTWRPADVQVNQMSAGYPVAGRMTVTNGAVFVCWQDSRNGNPGLNDITDIFANYSLDGGLSWGVNDVWISSNRPPTATTTDGSMTYPMIASSGSTVCVGWTESRSGNNRDVFVRSTPNLGATWPTEVRINNGVAPGGAEACLARMVMDGPVVTVAWCDNRGFQGSHFDIRANRSVDGGVTWLAHDVRLDHAPATQQVDDTFVALAAADGSCHAAWIDTRSNQGEVYYDLTAGFAPFGAGTAGSGGFVPHATGTGSALLGALGSIEFTQALGGAVGLALVGTGPNSLQSVPLLGGTLLVRPTTSTLLLFGGAPGTPRVGTSSLGYLVPANATLLGICITFQALLLDQGAVQGVSMSNAVQMWIG